MARLARARCTQERKLPRHTSKARAPAAWPHACGCDGAPRRRPHLPAGRASPPPSAWARPLPNRQQLRLVSMEEEATPCWSDAVYVHSAGLRPSAQMQGAQGRVVCSSVSAPRGLSAPHLCSIVGLSLAVRRCSFRPSSHRAARVKSQKCEKAELAHVVSGRGQPSALRGVLRGFSKQRRNLATLAPAEAANVTAF